jgi:hypothetical protein
MIFTGGFMKKLLLVSVCAVGSLVSFGAMADATVICTGGAAGNGAVPNSGTPGTHFMVNAIAPKCSTNVHLAGTDGTSGAWYTIGAVSAKGKNKFGGHTNGGSVAPAGACAVSGGCTAAEAVNARTAAETAAAAAGST